MVQITEELRAKAVIVCGDEICQEKYKLLLREVGLPTGLLPLKNVIECGYVEETGFVWLKQKSKIEHKFEQIGRHAIYGTEITAYAERYKIKKLTGVKVKEMMIWLTLGEIYVEDPENGKITFKSPTGIFRTFPSSAFEDEAFNEANHSDELIGIRNNKIKEPKESMLVQEAQEAVLVNE